MVQSVSVLFMIQPVSSSLIFHMCRKEEWQNAVAMGEYQGSFLDKSDGFIHFSTASQLRESAAKHQTRQDGLILLSVDPKNLPTNVLKWEESRSGELFPHLYGSLQTEAVVRFDPLPLGSDGFHIFPDDLAIPHKSGL